MAHLIGSDERLGKVAFNGCASIAGNCRDNLNIDGAEKTCMVDVDGVADECDDIHAFEEIDDVCLIECLEGNALAFDDDAVRYRIEREVFGIIETIRNIEAGAGHSNPHSPPPPRDISDSINRYNIPVAVTISDMASINGNISPFKGNAAR